MQSSYSNICVEIDQLQTAERPAAGGQAARPAEQEQAPIA